jgi:acyl-CoA thioesterase FadM
VQGFPHIHVERVRFSDCDPMGHANNAVFSTYLEQARITKSLELEHELHADGRVVAAAKSVLVGYDYAAGTSVPLTDEQRRTLAA